MNDTAATTLTRLNELLAKDFELKPEAMNPATRLEDLDIDSLRMIEILFSVEDAFKITVPADQQELRTKVQTVGDLAAYVDTLVGEQHGAGKAKGREARRGHRHGSRLAARQRHARALPSAARTAFR